MKFSKQALLGTTVLLGGSVLLYATMHQVLNAPAKPAANSQQVIAKPTTDKQSAISNEPLTADVATEKNLLAQKQKEREQRVAAQEQQAQQYMTEQQRIEAKLWRVAVLKINCMPIKMLPIPVRWLPAQ